MKKVFLLTLLLAFIFVNLNAQNPKRYIFLEHFTNTVCVICASKNPPFFEKIKDFPNDIHHISIHPPIPFTTCIFYNENTFENETLSLNYGINGTPQMYMWGERVSSGDLLSDATLQGALNQTSPISVDVSETGGTTRMVDVSVKAFEDIPATDNNRLFVAMVEGNVDYDAPNGERIHHNVFRELLTPVDGIPIGAILTGGTYDFQSSYVMSSSFIESEMYAIAWVQNADTKEVMNSGASSSAFITSNENTIVDESILIYPNPTSDLLRIEVGDSQIEKIDILSIDGKASLSLQGPTDQTTIDISNLDTGVYFVSIVTTKGIITKKITKI